MLTYNVDKKQFSIPFENISKAIYTNKGNENNIGPVNFIMDGRFIPVECEDDTFRLVIACKEVDGKPVNITEDITIDNIDQVQFLVMAFVTDLGERPGIFHDVFKIVSYNSKECFLEVLDIEQVASAQELAEMAIFIPLYNTIKRAGFIYNQVKEEGKVDEKILTGPIEGYHNLKDIFTLSGMQLFVDTILKDIREKEGQDD